MAAMPKVIKPMVIRERVIIHAGKRSSGTKLSQNLLHNKARRDIGDVCRIQKALPSRLTAGKANRMAMALRTKPARAKLAKETIVRIVPAGMGERSNGKTLKL